MIVNQYGRVAGSIDLATLAELYAQTDDDDLRAHYREVAAANGLDLDNPEGAEESESTEAQAEPPEPEVEADDEPASEYDELKAEAEELGVTVDGRWGVDRLRSEVEAAKEG